jgi:hypothetical protein
LLPQIRSSYSAGIGAGGAAAAAESADEGPQGTTTSATAAAAGSLATSSALQAPSQPSAAAAAAAVLSGGAGGLASMPVADLLAELGFPQLLHLFEAEMVNTVGVLSLMTHQDYADLKVPKGAALAIMAACQMLKEQQ